MLLAVVDTLIIMGAVTADVVRPGVHAAVVIVSAVVFGAMLLLIRDFYQPYRGLTGRAPTQTAFVRGMIAAGGHHPLPCDGRGLPRGEPGFHATTTPLR